MRLSRVGALLLVSLGGAGIVAGCGSSDFKSCSDTKTCADAGAAGQGDGGPGTGGTSGTGGASGTSGTAGASGSGSAGMDGGQSGAAGGGVDAGDAGEAEAAPVLDALGAPCTDGSTCDSTFCADGVCCDAACDGTCKSCNQTGHEGTCRNIASGQDPDKECLGSAASGAVCAGNCDGSGACTFPGAAVPCAGPTCSAGTQTDHACGGDGSCTAATTSCGKYACGASTCKTTCTLDSDCASTAWCNGGACEDKHDDGSQCTSNNQCANGHCVDSTCCATACAAPSTCGTGQCLCDGVACDSGHSCIVWHYDQDGDGHASVSATYDKASCDNVAPSPVSGHNYYATADDCYDQNASAKPGQTSYFTGDRGDGSFDYNCDNQQDKQYKEVPFGTQLYCTDCGVSSGGSCLACGSSVGGIAQYHMGFTCGACGTVTLNQEFNSAVACGATGTLFTCQTTSCNTPASSSSTKQGCH